MKIILTGANGLIGSRFEELMFDNHEIIPLRDVDIVNDIAITNFLEEKKADMVLHLAAKTDVDGCEDDKEADLQRITKTIGNLSEIEKMSWMVSDWIGTSSAFAVNFIGTLNLYRVAKKKGLKFVYISTDFVFSGDDKYREESTPEPINWYGMTKWYAESLIDVSKDLIVRLSFPYGYVSPVKLDFVQKLINLLRDKKEVSLIKDQTITPTFIDDIVYGLDFLLQKNTVGIYHLTGSSYESPYHIGEKIEELYGFKTKINTTTREQIYKGKASRPFQSIMKNDKIRNLGFTPKTFDEGLSLISKSRKPRT